jgi:pimeloyl-ACP methyl ester carboxylesterase
VNQGSLFEKIDGKNIAYRVTKPTIPWESVWDVVLIHGFAAWGKTWIDQESMFAKRGYTVYSLDLPPFGMSDEYDIDYFSREKQAYLINTFIKQRWLNQVILVAHSFWWKAAMEAYMNDPISFAWLILIDVALGFPKIETEFVPATGAIWYIMREEWVRDLLMRFVITNSFLGTRALQSFLYDTESLSDERLWIYKIPFQIQWKWEYLWDWLSYTVNHAESGKSNTTKNYVSIDIPTLLIWWKEDTITPLPQWVELQKMIQWSTLTILEKVNHIPQVEDPKWITNAIESFLDKNYQ